MLPAYLRLGPALIAAALASGAAQAQDAVEAFYRGKSVNVVIASAAGGGFDAYGRIVSRHLGRHIPGNPQILVQNMPAAASI